MNYKPVPGVSVTVELNAEQLAAHLASQFELLLLQLFKWISSTASSSKKTIQQQAARTWQFAVAYTKPGREDLQLLVKTTAAKITNKYQTHVVCPCTTNLQTIRQRYQKVLTQTHNWLAGETKVTLST